VISKLFMEPWRSHSPSRSRHGSSARETETRRRRRSLRPTTARPPSRPTRSLRRRHDAGSGGRSASETPPQVERRPSRLYSRRTPE